MLHGWGHQGHGKLLITQGDTGQLGARNLARLSPHPGAETVCPAHTKRRGYFSNQLDMRGQPDTGCAFADPVPARTAAAFVPVGRCGSEAMRRWV